MILHCGHCGKDYDAGKECDTGKISPGESVRCECGDLLIIPEPSDLENESVVRHYIRRWAKECGVSASSLRIEGGWEFIVDGVVLRMDHDASENNITVFGDLLQLPQEEVKQCELYQRVLKLNFHSTGEARFALVGDSLVVCFTRPTLGMDYHEFQLAVAAVAQVANDFDEELAEEFSDVYVPDEEELSEG